MEVHHKFETVNGKEQFVIYVDYPFEYEFGMDFNSFKENTKNVVNKIKEYATKNLSKVKASTALLVLNGIIIGTVVLSHIINPHLTISSSNISETKLFSTLEDEAKNVTVIASADADENLNANVDNNTSTEENTQNNTSTNNSNPSKINTTKISNKNTEKSTTTTTNTSGKTSNSVINTNSGIPIKVRLNSGNIITIGLEDYVTGVVASEMPASFHTEALKAQALAARTYALKKTSSGAILSASTSDQVYKTNDELKKMWGSSYDAYYNKIKNAVYATRGEYLTYKGNYIEALYFSTSNGKTEDSVYVWGNSHPYLKSVDCKWDVGVSNFTATKTIPISTVAKKLGVPLTSSSQIKINSRTTGGRVNSITVCEKEFTGVKIRTLLGLRSADFSISVSGNSLVFTTKGYGHGVGMSQYGANGMAKAGYSYSQIVKYFYTGVNISKK